LSFFPFAFVTTSNGFPAPGQILLDIRFPYSGALQYRPVRQFVIEIELMITVLVADNHKMMQQAISDLLRSAPDIEVIGAATTFAEVIEQVGRLVPQVILLDLYLGDDDQLARTQIKSSLSRASVIAMSFVNDGEVKLLAKEFGAVALIDKSRLADDLIAAIKQCSTG
jgi:DNA-binding NarL/FixJ family response regulator